MLLDVGQRFLGGTEVGEAPAAESIVSFLMGQGNGDVLTWEASRKGILTPGAHEAPMISEKALASRSVAGSWKFAWPALFLCLSDPSL